MPNSLIGAVADLGLARAVPEGEGPGWAQALGVRWEAGYRLVVPAYDADGALWIETLDDSTAALTLSRRVTRTATLDGGAVIVDADVFIAPRLLESAVLRAIETGRVTWAFRRWLFRGCRDDGISRMACRGWGVSHQ